MKHETDIEFLLQYEKHFHSKMVPQAEKKTVYSNKHKFYMRLVNRL